MRNANVNQADLPPLKFIPEPVVIETDGDSAWAAWDAAVREQDSPSDRAAMRLAEVA